MQDRSTGTVEAGLGYAGTRAEALTVWEAAAARWAHVNRRPTPGDIAVYEALGESRLDGRVLILGVTPELRDLVARAGAQPVLVDMSAAMHEATTRLLRHADAASEHWIGRDWREAELPQSSFDLVLGDMIWWIVSVATQHELRDTIHAALQPDGLFVGRFRFADPNRARVDPSPVVAAYLDRLDGASSDSRAVETELLYWLYDHTADHANRRLARARTQAMLLELAEEPQFSRHAEFLRDAATRVIGADWTCQPRGELLDLLSPGFDLEAEGRADDYDSVQHPILALRPR